MIYFVFVVLSVSILLVILYLLFRGDKQEEEHELPGADHYTRLKDIYLELHNYSFYHSPSGINKTDERFVGRRQVIHKLKSLIMRTSTRAGTYLVTGFRGMGKTSLVNNVINELKGTDATLTKRVGRMLFLLVFFGLFDLFDFGEQSTEVSRALSMGMIIIGIISIIYWVIHDQIKQDFDPELWPQDIPLDKQLKSILGSFTRIFDLNSRYHRRTYILNFMQELVIVLIMQALIQFLIHGFAELSRPLSYLLVWGLLLISQQFILTRKLLAKSKERENCTQAEKVTFYIKKTVGIFTKRINYSHVVPIKISLAQDDIRDIDLLKIIAKSIYNHYKDMRRFTFSYARIIVFLVTGLIGYVLIGICFYQQSVYKFTNELRNSSDLVVYFPSQSLFPLDTHSVKGEYASVYLSTLITETGDVDSIALFTKWLEGIDELNGQNLNLSPEAYNGGIYRYTAALDFYLFWGYQSTKRILFGDKINNDKSRANHRLNESLPLNLTLSGDFRLLPAVPDYLFVLVVIGFFVVISLLSRYSYLIGLVQHRYVLTLLKELNESLDSEVTSGSGGQVGGGGGIIGLFRNRSSRRPIAGVREVERDLIYFFNQVDRIPAILYRPQFIFVFDELDKINPREFETRLQLVPGTNNEYQEVPDRGAYLKSNKVPRARLMMVQELLSNLKLFFNTAKAKFIFIAGREMYDAAMADIADRESLLGSIFHDVLYVNSFYKDPIFEHATDIDRQNKPSTLTTLTEEYICQFLVPPNYEPSLAGFGRYIKEVYFPDCEEDMDRQKIHWEKRTKLHYTVRNFITYIAYRSHGSPMRVITLLEDYIVNMDDFHEREKLMDKTGNLIVGRNKKSLFLYFDYYIQYKLGFGSSIFRPYLLSRAVVLKEFEDKVLVSTTYIMDHLYKFHAFGFSWRNLELTPEIIHIHKAPQLRRFIQDLIDYLSGTLIRPVYNGLNQYSFTAKAKMEFSYISKIFERESAAFNFTLDESHPVKNHYKEKLLELKKSNKDIDSTKRKYIHSIGFVNMVIGDLHFFDKEYDDAVIYYTEAIQWLRDKPAKDISIYQTVLLMRNMLKLGLTLERMHTFDAALVAYGQLTELVRRSVKVLNKGYEKNNISAKWEKASGKNGKELSIGSIEEEQIKEEIRTEGRFYFKLDLFENLTAMYLPLLCKLHALEKESLSGLTEADVKGAIRGFNEVFEHVKNQEKYILKSDFCNRLGTILYYKNGEPISEKRLQNHEISVVEQIFEDVGLHKDDYRADYKPATGAYEYYIESLDALREKALHINQLSATFSPLIPNRDQLHKQQRQIGQMLDFYWLLKMDIHTLNLAGAPIVFLEQVANCFSNLGDSIYCFTSKSDSINEEYAQNLIETLTNHKQYLIDVNIKKRTHTVGRYSEKDLFDQLVEAIPGEKTIRNHWLHQALLCNAISARFYYRAGRRQEYAFQLKKILYVLKLYQKFHLALHDNKKNTNQPKAIFGTPILSTIKEKLLKEVFKATANANDNVIFQEHSKFKDEFELPEEHINDATKFPQDLRNYLSYTRLSFNYEAKLTALHYYDMMIDAGMPQTTLRNVPITAHTVASNSIVRTFELSHKCRVNYYYLHALNMARTQFNDYQQHNIQEATHRSDWVLSDIDTLLSIDVSAVMPNSLHDPLEALEYLIIDSLFCYLKLITELKLHGINYVTGHSYHAYAYMYLGHWSDLFNQLKDIYKNAFGEEKVAHLEARLLKMVNRNDTHYMDVNYCYKRANHHFYRCISMNNEGKEYKAAIKNMFIAEDDLNDNNVHFCAAVERYLINIGEVRQNIKWINVRLSIANPSEALYDRLS